MRRVDPKVYTKEYYLADCTGFKEFRESYGQKLEPRLEEVVRRINILPGMNVLDVGCGRGEMVFYAARQGANAVGIDYAGEAIGLANELKKKKEKSIREKMQFHIMDAKNLLFPSSSFDIVILTDVVEHLYDEEINKVFLEIKRVLKRNGTIVIHTAPNKLFFNIGYRVYSYPIATFLVAIWNALSKSSYPNIAKPDDLRVDSHAIMHINEPTYFSLKKLFNKHNFKGYVLSTNVVSKKPIVGLKDKFFNFIVYLHPLSAYFPFNILLGSDFIAILKNKK